MASPLQKAQTHDDRVHGSPKVKVTILASEWGSSNGGLSTINRELAIQLAKFPEVEITFFLPKCSQEDKNVALDHKVKIVEATPLSCYEPLDWLCSPPEDLEIDIVVGHGVKLGKQAQVIKKSKTCKWVQVVHTDPEELGMFKSYSRPILKGAEKHKNEVELCEMADHVIGIGPKLSEAYRSHLCGGNKDGNVFELTPGVFEEFKTENHVSRGDMRQRRVLVFGRGDAEDFEVKGFDIAGKAIAALQDTRLVFVGAPAGKLEETAKRLMEYGVPASRLIVKEFVGDRESLRRLLLQADLVVMPSRTEGFGLTGLEAMSAGRPVLVSRNSGFGEALCRTATGSAFVIESDDPTVWTAAIQKIWNKDRECRLEEAVKLRDNYDRKFDWAKQIKELVDKMISLTHDRRINSLSTSNSLRGLASNLIKCTRVMSKRLLTPWLMIILLCHYSVTLLDPRSYQDGCPVEDVGVPFETKEFNMPDYLDAARAENFTGRRWLYEEIEDAFKDKDIAGVQIVGSPGSGKSALSSQLICSRSSSPIIHTSILGYHFCKYSDKNTQMAGKFVRNLAEMIARRLPEYGYLVSNNSFIKRSLTEDCIHYQDPVGCFQLAVLSPLRNLTNKPRENWFVVLDALDECITQGETGHSIVYLLNNKIHLFPAWFKVIVTLRNESEAFLRSSKVKTIVIDPEDSRNLEDLEIFVTTRLLQETPLLHLLTWWFGDDSVKSATKLITEVLSKSQGNFLFVNELLNNWEQTTTELRNVFESPKSLGDLFYAYFKRLYPSEESFKSVRHILELLVSTFEPLKRKQIFKLLKTGENNLDEYDFKNRLKGLSHFLQYGKDNNTLTLYHLSLTEWLTSEENEDFFVSKRKGHETFCEYYIGLIRETEESKLSGYILNLAQHIALSGMKEAFVQEFINLPSQTVNASDLQNNRTLLHRAATINNSYALELVLRHFSRIDCVDDRGITPAFLAAEHGLLDNLALLVEKGAEINQKTKTMVEFNKERIIRALQQAINNDSDISAANRILDMSLHQSKSKLFDSSMLHAAAQGGHTSVVRFLIKNNANISMLNGGYLTAIQIAAENGHVKVVKTLKEARAVADKSSLYRAAADNRLEVVNFLLDNGVEDDCRIINCFKVEQLSQRIFLGLPSPHRDETSTLCDGSIGPGSTQRASALAAAVASGHGEVVNSLLSKEHNASICSRYSGGALLGEVNQDNNRGYLDLTLGRRPHVTYFYPNGKQTRHILSLDFTESGIIECRKPLNYSVFHLLSYLSPTFEHKNAFYVAPRCRRLDEHSTMCQETGPLAEGIEQYPRKEWIISSCFDAEGFAPLHRAAQGANLVAIRYFLANGVDTSILSQNGYDALTLAVLHAGRRRLWEHEGRVAADADYEHLIRAEQAAITLLRHAVNGGFKVRCNSSKPDLTLYHLAASRGLVKFIETLFNESDLHHLDVDCVNADGITPIYLANLFQQRVQDGLDNPWKKVIQIIKQHGGEMRYPREDAEYNLIYNGVYGWIPYEFTLDLRPDIKHFITSFLTSYEKSENKSFRCSFGRNLDLARENYYHDWLVTWLWRKISDTVGPVIKPSEKDMSTTNRGTGPRLSRERERFRRDMRRCSLHVRQFRQYLSRILLHKQAYPKNILKNDYWETFSKARGNYWFQRELQILMNMRHTEVFRAFACLKSLSSRLKPVYHLDARSLTDGVRQYEKNPPVDNYLNLICDSLQYIFEGYTSFRISRQQPSEFRLRENEFFSRSGFFNGPVKISRQTSLIGRNLIEWPLEFFLRRSLGFFRRYDYLKTLHIGIEPRTYIHLYPDKIRQLINRDKMWYEHA